MKNLPAVKKNKNFKPVTDILRDPSAAAKLQNYIDEAVRCKMKINDEQESIKTLRQSAVDQVSIEPKQFNYLVGLCYNNNYDAKKKDLEEQLETIQVIQGELGYTPPPSDEDEEE